MLNLARLTRRQTLTGASALVAAHMLPAVAFAQNARNVPLAELLADSPMPDIWQGKDEASVTIIEYASMTCSHCAAFHNGTYKQLKEKYIDTGRVRFTIREFPFDPLSMAGFMLARCQGADKRAAMIELLFAQQNAWTGDRPLEGLTTLTRQAGMAADAFKACLDDKKAYEEIGRLRDRAQQKFGVSSTPTFFINGTVLQGNQSLEEFEKAMAPFLK